MWQTTQDYSRVHRNESKVLHITEATECFIAHLSSAIQNASFDNIGAKIGQSFKPQLAWKLMKIDI